jgi:hypothetical protein
MDALRFARWAVASGVARPLRENSGLSRTEMAKAAGCSADAVRAWETGRRRPHGYAGSRYGVLLRELVGGVCLSGGRSSQ